MMNQAQMNNFYFQQMMKLIIVSISLALFTFIVKTIDGFGDCLFGFCFGISCLCGVYFVHWICSYFYCKRKIQEITNDLDRILTKDFLLSKLSEDDLQSTTEKN